MRQQKQQKNQKQKRQEWFVVLAGLTVIGASVVSTLWFSGFFSGGGSAGYRHITFTDAVLQCEAELRQRYPTQLRVLTLDDHSSRYDQGGYQYKVFHKAQMANADSEASVSDFYFSCSVNAGRGRIAALDVFEQKEAQTEAIRREEGGLFGWP